VPDGFCYAGGGFVAPMKKAPESNPVISTSITTPSSLSTSSKNNNKTIVMAVHRRIEEEMAKIQVSTQEK
jgi:hypothetical protein